MAESTALIFQKRLLRWSETFIASQGGALSRYRPVFAGIQHQGGGAAYLEGHERCLLTDHAPFPVLGKWALQSLRRPPRAWVDALREYRPAILHAHFITNGPLVIPLARALRVPLIVTCHGMDIAVEPRGARQGAERSEIFAAADRIIAVSEFIADRLRAAGCPSEKITVHHIGIDTDRFRPGAPQAGSLARAPIILFVGRLVAKKGLHHLLRVMPAVQRSLPGARLIIAGDGPLRAELEAEAERLGVDCYFLGVQTPAQIRTLMLEATLLCAPSIVAANGDAEGLPMTILEAQASALPVVAFPSGGSAEGIRHGETGLIAPAGDEAKLTEYLLAILADPERQRSYASAARSHAVTHFDLRRQTALLEDIYDEVREAGRGDI